MPGSETARRRCGAATCQAAQEARPKRRQPKQEGGSPCSQAARAERQRRRIGEVVGPCSWAASLLRAGRGAGEAEEHSAEAAGGRVARRLPHPGLLSLAVSFSPPSVPPPADAATSRRLPVPKRRPDLAAGRRPLVGAAAFGEIFLGVGCAIRAPRPLVPLRSCSDFPPPRRLRRPLGNPPRLIWRSIPRREKETRVGPPSSKPSPWTMEAGPLSALAPQKAERTQLH